MWCRISKALCNHDGSAVVHVSSMQLYVHRRYLLCEVPLHHAQPQDAQFLLAHLL